MVRETLATVVTVSNPFKNFAEFKYLETTVTNRITF